MKLKNFLFLVSLFVVSCSDPSADLKNQYIESARAFLPNSSSRALCEDGLQAFKTTVHVLLRKDCLPCHDLGGKGPPHAVEDINTSYPFIVSYVNWGDMPHSKLIEIGGNRHCIDKGGNCVSDEATMASVLKDWWEKGQKNCPTMGKILTTPLSLSQLTNSWTKIRWDLGKIDLKYDLIFLNAEMKKEGDLYFIRKFRIEGNDKPLRLKKFYLVLNANLLNSSFAFIDATVMPNNQQEGAVLSSYTVTFRSSQEIADRLSIGFDELTFTKPLICHELDTYKKKVKPTLEIRRCASCHGNEQDPAYKKLAFSNSDEKNCNALLERGQGKYLVDSPLIAYPLRAINDHLEIIPNNGEVFPHWIEWLENEKKHE